MQVESGRRERERGKKEKKKGSVANGEGGREMALRRLEVYVQRCREGEREREGFGRCVLICVRVDKYHTRDTSVSQSVGET